MKETFDFQMEKDGDNYIVKTPFNKTYKFNEEEFYNFMENIVKPMIKDNDYYDEDTKKLIIHD